MIVTMLATLSAIVLTGLFAEGRTGGAGRLSALPPRDSVVLLGDVHAWLGFAIMWLAAVHVAGVLFESLLHRENLVRSMLIGRKKTVDPNHANGQVSLWRAIPLLILLVIMGAWLAAGTHLPPAR